jgi:hypothetical protein
LTLILDEEDATYWQMPAGANVMPINDSRGRLSLAVPKASDRAGSVPPASSVGTAMEVVAQMLASLMLGALRGPRPNTRCVTGVNAGSAAWTVNWAQF